MGHNLWIREELGTGGMVEEIVAFELGFSHYRVLPTLGNLTSRQGHG
jgi:hypothetical protein